MPIFTLAHDGDWNTWRRAARAFVLMGVAPEDMRWTMGGEGGAVPEAEGGFSLSRALVSLLAQAFQAREPERFGVLYTLIWRAHQGALTLDDADDPDLRLARHWALAVRADAHRMRAHLRYLPVTFQGQPHHLGWYEPDHWVLEANARLLARRDAAFGFSIVTPDGTAHHDADGLRFGEGLKNPGDDETLLAWWEAHQDTILASAREGFGVPEAEEQEEVARPPGLPPLGPVVLPPRAFEAVATLTREASGCERCDLWKPATQTVFGEGPAGARVMFIGEQPGDQEDVIGRPFVGPAGQLLDEVLEEAGIDRRQIYITNAVKHFKFTQRGQRRIHQPPSPEEIRVCRAWLDAERAAVNPALVVLLGGSAGRAVLGRPVAVMKERGRSFPLADGGAAFLTVHPSYLSRLPDAEARARERAGFLRDLRTVRGLMEAGP